MYLVFDVIPGLANRTDTRQQTQDPTSTDVATSWLDVCFGRRSSCLLHHYTQHLPLTESKQEMSTRRLQGVPKQIFQSHLDLPSFRVYFVFCYTMRRDSLHGERWCCFWKKVETAVACNTSISNSSSSSSGRDRFIHTSGMQTLLWASPPRWCINSIMPSCSLKNVFP